MKLGGLIAIVFALLIGCQYGEGGYGRDNRVEAYESVKLRRARSHPVETEAVPPDALTSSKVDPALLNDIGAAVIGAGTATVERKRRDRGDVDLHAERAESDALAAAAESAAAEADAVAAAVEVAEVEEANGNGESRGSHHVPSSRFDDSEMTFEENDDGDNVVKVEQDLREKEHTGRDKNHFHLPKSAEMSEFDIDGTGGGASHGSNHGSHTSSQEELKSISSSSNSFGSMDLGSETNGKGYADVQAPLNALLTESSDLAKEIRLVFQVLARREDYLVKEMEKLKIALQNAIQVLETNNKEAKIIRKRRDNDDSNPYKACVYINPPPNQDSKFASPQALLQQQTPAPSAPTDYDYDQQPTPTGGGSDEIDLSSVYWLKLPENEDEGILERVHRVLTGVRDSGKDVLFIPVTKSYMSNGDVAKGFLKAVRINPAYTTSSVSKQRRRRKKLRLRIRRI